MRYGPIQSGRVGSYFFVMREHGGCCCEGSLIICFLIPLFSLSRFFLNLLYLFGFSCEGSCERDDEDMFLLYDFMFFIMVVGCVFFWMCV